LGPDTQKRTVSSAQIQDLRLAIVSPSRNSRRFFALGDDQSWFKERLDLIHILSDEITTCGFA
jgi:hypothetical protein